MKLNFESIKRNEAIGYFKVQAYEAWKNACGESIVEDICDAIRTGSKETYTAKELLSIRDWRDVKTMNENADTLPEPSLSVEESVGTRKHGSWIDAEIPFEGEAIPIQVCSECNTFFFLSQTGGGHRYCPACGAKMDLEIAEDTQSAGYYKVAIAVDLEDWISIETLVNDIPDGHKTFDWSTVDNTYRCVYWDNAEWSTAETNALERALDSFRHAFLSISEDGRITAEHIMSDDRGCDEEFSDMLHWSADLSFWDPEWVLTPVGRFQKHMPISRERAIELLTSYVENDLQSAESWYIHEALQNAGATDREIRALGLDWCIPTEEDEEDTDDSPRCCICGAPIEGYGNDPWPVSEAIGDRCCDLCNMTVVMPARLKGLQERKNEVPEKPVHLSDCASMPVREPALSLDSILADATVPYSLAADILFAEGLKTCGDTASFTVKGRSVTVEMIENIRFGRESSLWYGGQLARISVEGEEDDIIVAASGDVQARLVQTEDPLEPFYVKDRNNAGELGKALDAYVPDGAEGDIILDSLLEGEYQGLHLFLDSGNWFEAYVENGNADLCIILENSSTVYEAIAEAIDNVGWFHGEEA